MRLISFILCALVCATLAAATPRGYLLVDTATGPARVMAKWLGASISLQGRTLTLSREGQSLTVPLDRRAAMANGKAMILPAPAYALDGMTYLPVRTVAETFSIALAWDSKNSTLILSSLGRDPLVLMLAPFPRPASVRDETLAGLTPGDHLAFAVARWGDPVSDEPSATVTGGRQLEFGADPSGGVQLTVVEKDGKLYYVRTTVTGVVLFEQLDAAVLRATGAGHGLTLARNIPKSYGEGGQSYQHPSEDVAIRDYRRGSLVLIGLYTFWGRRFELTELTLARRGFPKAQLQMNGPVAAQSIDQ